MGVVCGKQSIIKKKDPKDDQNKNNNDNDNPIKKEKTKK